MNESQLFPVVVRTEIDYIYPAKLGDEVMVRAQLSEVGRVRAVCEFALTAVAEAGGPRVFANARQTVALVQMPAGRPVRLPREWTGKGEAGR